MFEELNEHTDKICRNKHSEASTMTAGEYRHEKLKQFLAKDPDVEIVFVEASRVL